MDDRPLLKLSGGTFRPMTHAELGRPIELPDDFQLDGWVRLPGETVRHYRAYCAYRDLGGGRSHAATAAKLGLATRGKNGNNNQITRWASRFRWTQRIALYEIAVADLERKAIQERIIARAQKLAEDRLDLYEQEVALGDKLLSRADKMLEHPLTRVTKVTDDGRILEISPYKWTGHTIVEMLQLASELKRRGLELPTTYQDADLPPSTTGGADLSQFSERERRAHELGQTAAAEAYFAAYTAAMSDEEPEMVRARLTDEAKPPEWYVPPEEWHIAKTESATEESQG